MSKLDLTKLRETAKQAIASDGGWFTSYFLREDSIGKEDAEHIAAFDPTTCVALLDRLEEAEAMLRDAERDLRRIEMADWDIHQAQYAAEAGANRTRVYFEKHGRVG